tara:strand:- start:1248 stop:1643 length:396 start_codon:yes stop_codon:yes gene_type:complete
MSANNTRIRRIIADILFDSGPLTKEGVAKKLGQIKTIRAIPSPHSLASLLCKNIQIVSVGSAIVESAVGTKSKHLLYDINRDLIKTKDDLIYTRSPTIMTPSEKRKAQKCRCGKLRVFPPKEDICLHCLRK